MKATETKFRSTPYLPGQLLSQVIWCLGALILSCSSASAQNLFVTGWDGSTGVIYKFTPDGTQSTFASGLSRPGSLAFDSAGNLFAADSTIGPGSFISGAIYKFTPDGMRSTFALGLDYPGGLAFDSAGNLFVADITGPGSFTSGAIYKFTPDGVRTTFASGLNYPNGLAIDSADNLFVGDTISGSILKFTPSGVRTTFASGLFDPFALAFDSRGNLFVADRGFDYDLIFGAAVYKFTPSGRRSTVASEDDQVRVIPDGLAIDSADNLFVADGVSGSILKFTPSGVRTTFASRFVTDYMAFQPTLTPTPTPTPTPTATPTPTPTPTATPAMAAVSLKASPTKVHKGGTATFTASASPSNLSQNIVVNFSTSGSAVNGTDYTLSASQITIPAGQSSGSVTFHVTTTKTKGKEKAIMTLQDGMGYAVITKNKANIVKVTIQNN